MTTPKPVGRPAGSGAQLTRHERVTKSRQQRAAAGAVRFDLMLNAEHAEKLVTLQKQWQCKTRKETIERAIASVFATIHGTATPASRCTNEQHCAAPQHRITQQGQTYSDWQCATCGATGRATWD